ncbi:MAG: DUF2341 domain-containing protein [Euryarchaeota archaeon]|nr:DUF2341 domain-containing protein [Euryarchaeota archaeon]
MNKIFSLVIFFMLMGSVFTVFHGINTCAASSRVGENWFDNSWQYRKHITIDHTKVAADLNNFPILITTTLDASKVRSDGNDIIFTDVLSTLVYSHEIETYNQTTGDLIVWVNITSLSSSVDTIIYMYYGNPTYYHLQNQEGTWDSNYLAVWHVGEASGSYFDSTSYNNNGFLTDVNNNSVRGATGKIGNCIDLNGDSDFINFGNPSSLRWTGAMTLEAWMNIDVLGTTNSIIGKTTDQSTQGNGYNFWFNGNNNLAGQQNNNPGSYDYKFSNSTQGSGAWYHFVGVYPTDSSTRIKLYINGTESSSYGGSGGAITGRVDSSSCTVGYTGFGSGSFTNGKLDEVRISKVLRSGSWISTEYNNQNNPTTFTIMGAEETQSNIWLILIAAFIVIIVVVILMIISYIFSRRKKQKSP